MRHNIVPDPVRKGLVFLFFLFLSISFSFPQTWDDSAELSQTYSKTLISLNLDINYLEVTRPTGSPSNILVYISENQKDDLFYRVLCEKLCQSLSLLEYVTTRTYFTQSNYPKEKLRQYLKYHQLAAAWPPVYWEPKEIEREISKGNYSKKFLLLSGFQTRILVHSNIAEDFDSLVIISPSEDLLKLDGSSLKNKQILWVGDKLEEEKLKKMTDKFGGKILTYERSSRGKSLLMRHTAAINDILDFLNQV